MNEISQLTPSGEGVFRGLVEEGSVGRVTVGFMIAIENSFSKDGARVTQNEVKRRFDICAKIFRTLRGDLHWGIERIEGHLPEYLRAELDGKPWEPDDREVWIPSDG